MYQSIPSLTISLGKCSERANSPPPGTKKVQTPTPGQKNRAKTPPPGQLYSEIQQQKTVLNEMLILFRNIEKVKHIKIKAFWWVAFMDIRNISSHTPFICKPTQEIHDKQVTEYDFDK